MRPHFDQKPATFDAMLVRIAPLERIQIPQQLDGRYGRFRLPHERRRIDADTDLEAINIWLSQYTKTETFRAYRTAAERLVNWALIERKKPVSSLEESDFVAFEEFLASPHPDWRWISSRRASRADVNWRPFCGPLSAKAKLHTLCILRVMSDWLKNRGYCDVTGSLWRHAVRAVPEPSALVYTVGRDMRRNVIEFDDWHLLRRSLGNDENLPARLATELMYYGALTVKEVAGARLCDLVEENSTLMLKIPTRHAHLSLICLAPPLVQTIRRALSARRGSVQTLTITDGSELLVGHREIGGLVKRELTKASQLALSEGNSIASNRLKMLTPHSLRHAFEIHATLIRKSEWLWVLIGAAWLLPQATRKYLPPRTLKERTEDLQRAFFSLAWCWGGEENICPAEQLKEKLQTMTNRS